MLSDRTTLRCPDCRRGFWTFAMAIIAPLPRVLLVRALAVEFGSTCPPQSPGLSRGIIYDRLSPVTLTATAVA